MMALYYLTLGTSMTLDIILIYLYVTKLKNYKEEVLREKIDDEIQKYMSDVKFQRILEDAIDRSKLARDVNRLILILCTNNQDIKNSPLCQGL